MFTAETFDGSDAWFSRPAWLEAKCARFSGETILLHSLLRAAVSSDLCIHSHRAPFCPQ